MIRLEDYDKSNRFTAKVLETSVITPEASAVEVRDIILEVDKKDFRFDVGQSVGVIVSGPHELGHTEHFRLYTVANTFETSNGKKPVINLCVRRCTYIDDFSGEEYKGIASNYLCDRRAGDTITLTGPYGIPWEVPEEKDADLILIGLGTGIAPFRAFVKHIYKNVGGWQGRVWLFHGALTGLEMLYRNDKRDDFTNYYDEETFEAFEALSPRPHVYDPIALDYALEERGEEIWNMLLNPKTHVYVAGMENIRKILNKAFSNIAGSPEKWERRKAEMMAGKRWTELVY